MVGQWPKYHPPWKFEIIWDGNAVPMTVKWTRTEHNKVKETNEERPFFFHGKNKSPNVTRFVGLTLVVPS